MYMLITIASHIWEMTQSQENQTSSQLCVRFSHNFLINQQNKQTKKSVGHKILDNFNKPDLINIY